MNIKRAPNSSGYFYRQKLKADKKKEIISALRIAGQMGGREIIELIPGMSEITANRYLDELLAVGCIQKVQPSGMRKNARVYEFHADYGARLDLVGRALSHPLHQLTLLLAKRLDENA